MSFAKQVYEAGFEYGEEAEAGSVSVSLGIPPIEQDDGEPDRNLDLEWPGPQELYDDSLIGQETPEMEEQWDDMQRTQDLQLTRLRQ